MSKRNIGKNLKSIFAKKGNDILFFAGLGGVLGGGVLGVIATPKAMEALEARKKELGVDKLGFVETVKTGGKYYAGAISCAAVGTFSLCRSRQGYKERNAELGAFCTALEQGAARYQRAVIDTVGEKAEEEIREKVAKTEVRENPIVPEVTQIVETGHSGHILYEPETKTYFHSRADIVRNKALKLAEWQQDEMYAMFNEWLEAIGLEKKTSGAFDFYGWDINRNGTIRISIYWDDDTDEYPGQPVGIISYSNQPIHVW